MNIEELVKNIMESDKITDEEKKRLDSLCEERDKSSKILNESGQKILDFIINEFHLLVEDNINPLLLPKFIGSIVSTLAEVIHDKESGEAGLAAIQFEIIGSMADMSNKRLLHFFNCKKGY